MSITASVGTCNPHTAFAPYINEWLSAGADLDFIGLNVAYLSGNEAVEAVLGPALEQTVLNNPRQVSFSAQRSLNHYDHLTKGGWAVEGIDPATGRKSGWVEFKPVEPRVRPDGKVIKYEAQPKATKRIHFLAVPGNPNFWAEVRDQNKTIYIGEGAKKSAALLRLGYASIALPSINGGYSATKLPDGQTESRDLHLDLLPFATAGREVVILFDQDDKDRTKRTVNQAAERFAALLVAAGCTVRRITWDSSIGKGLDDYWAAVGDDGLKALLETEGRKIGLLEEDQRIWARPLGGLTSFVAQAAKSAFKSLLQARENDGELTFTNAGGDSPSLVFKPGQVLPVEEWIEAGRPKVFISEDVAATLQEMSEKGYSHMIARDVPGTGKSHVAGEWAELRTQMFGEPMYICSSEYRNPTTETLALLPETPSVGPLTHDHEYKTATGEPYRRNGSAWKHDIKALCIHHETVEKLREYGVPQNLGPQSSLCQNCIHAADLSKCPLLAAREAVAGEPALRTHINSLPKKGGIAIIDEAGASIETSRELLFDRDALVLEGNSVKGAQKYQRVGYALDPAVTLVDARLRDVLATLEGEHHGLPHKTVMEHLPSREELIQHTATIRGEDFAAVDAEWDGWIAEAQKCLQPNMHHNFARAYNDPELRATQIATMTSPANMPHLLRVLSGEAGDISITHDGKIRLTLPEYRHAQLLKGYDTVFLMDATGDIPDLARATQTDEDQWCEVSWGDARFENLTIEYVEGVGACGQNRRNDGQFSLQTRLVTLVDHQAAESLEQGRKLGVLDLARFGECYSKIDGVVFGAQFRDSRGSNIYKGMPELLAINPNAMLNLGALLTQWNLERGEALTLEDASPEFVAWTRQKGRENLLQVVGRCRAQHYPQTAFRVRLVGSLDMDDLEALSGMYRGATVKATHISKICVEAAPRGIQTNQRIIEALQDALRAGQLNQEWIGHQLDVHSSTVSRYVTKTFGTGFWYDLRRICNLLYKGLNSKLQISEEEKASLPEAAELLQEFLPALASEIREKLRTAGDTAIDLVETFAAVGDEAFAQCLKLLSYNDALALFCSIVSLVHPMDVAALGKIDAKKLLHPSPPKLRTA